MTKLDIAAGLMKFVKTSSFKSSDYQGRRDTREFGHKAKLYSQLNSFFATNSRGTEFLFFK